MKVQITHMKAPWPSGAVVGDVLELDEVPAWAVGKCKPAAGSDVTIQADQVQAVAVDTDEASESIAEAEQQAAQEKAAIHKGKKYK